MLHLVTVANKDCPGLQLWKKSALRCGYKPIILGMGGGPLGHDAKQFGLKFFYLKQFLNEIPKDDYVLFTDGFDVVFKDGPEIVLGKTLQVLQKDILMAAETGEAPDKGNPYIVNHDSPYLNSGVYIGRAKAILDVMPSSFDNLDDQRYFTQIYFHSNKIQLDHDGVVFQCMLGSPYKGKASILHFQGKWKYVGPVVESLIDDKEIQDLAWKIHLEKKWFNYVYDNQIWFCILFLCIAITTKCLL